MELNICDSIRNNIEWIAPLIAAIVMPLASIIIVNRYTKKQIDNQNKENHRPFMKLLSIEYDPKSSIDNYHYFLHTSNNRINTQLHYKVVLTIKNIGYGIAKNIKLKCPENSLFDVYSKNTIKTLNLGIENIEKITISFPGEFYFCDRFYEFVLYYESLYGPEDPIPLTYKHRPPGILIYESMQQINKNTAINEPKQTKIDQT